MPDRGIDRELIGALLQRRLDGIELFGDFCGWVECHGHMHVYRCLLEFVPYLLIVDELRYLLLPVDL